MQIKEIMTGEPVVVGPEEQRQEWTLSDRLQDFIDMKDDAEIVEGRANAVDIGCQVTVRDTGTGEQRTFVVGSYQVLDQQHENEISYAAPLARPLMGASVGKEREVAIGDRTVVYRVVGIE